MTAIILPMTVSGTCKHCRQRKVSRPRGLCWNCYDQPGVKNLHPSVSKYGRRGEGQLNRNRMPDWPTDAPPGSAAKLEVLADRALRNQALWHPLDARFPGDSRPFGSLAAAA